MTSAQANLSAPIPNITQNSILLHYVYGLGGFQSISYYHILRFC